MCTLYKVQGPKAGIEASTFNNRDIRNALRACFRGQGWMGLGLKEIGFSFLSQPHKAIPRDGLMHTWNTKKRKCTFACARARARTPRSPTLCLSLRGLRRDGACAFALADQFYSWRYRVTYSGVADRLFQVSAGPSTFLLQKHSVRSVTRSRRK